MILYHGTTLSRGEGIIKDHCIKHDISRVYTNTGKLDCDTTNGYVYLTPNIETAYFYGNINSLRSETNHDLKYVYIFKVEINEDKLLPDYDELKIKKIKSKDVTWKESLAICKTVRVDEDVNVNKAEYLMLPNTMNHKETEDNLNLVRELSKSEVQSLDANVVLKEILSKWSWQKL